MEPQLPTPYTSPERGPASDGQRREKLPAPQVEQSNSPRPEIVTPAGQERKGTEQQTQSGGGGDPAWKSPVVPPTSVSSPAHDPPTGATSVVNDTPLTANDDDLIEQEWVQKAKRIVSSTKNDPYKQEHEVSKLQADYLQKRYGKEIKLPSDQ